MSLCTTPLTAACEKELQRLVALVPDPELSAFAASEPNFLQGGFRLGNASALRARVAQLATSQAPISDGLRALIARRSLARTLTGLLSAAALAEARHALASVLGAPPLLVALLLDSRPEVRGLAEGWLSISAPFLDVSEPEARQNLSDLFGGLAFLLGNGAEAVSSVPIAREAWRVQKEQLELRVRDLQETNRRLKGAEDRATDVARKLASLEKNASATCVKLEAAEKALRETRAERESLRVELARETAHREERLTAALDVALANEIFGWVRHAREVEREATDTDAGADLLMRAERALKRQSDTDRHSGNRETLAKRLEQLRAAHERVAAALREALRPAHELKTIEPELCDEIRRLTALLDPDAPATPLESALVARIHGSDDNELPALRTLPDFVATLRILDEKALARIRLVYQKRVAAIQAVGVPLDLQAAEMSHAASRLGRALAGQGPAILLIDGHNVLFGLPARYNPPRGGAVNDAEKRRRLTDDIVRISSPTPTLRAWIVFDGPTRTDAQAAQNVRVTYSGGTGEHRADSVLLDNLRFFKSAAPELSVFLVSNDADLCSASRRLGAETVAVLDFGAFL